MSASVEYLADDDLILFRCASCGATETESKGRAGFKAAIAAFLNRAHWRASAICEKKRLTCPDCERSAASARLVANIREWIARERKKERARECLFAERTR